MIIRDINDNWQQLIDDNGKIIAENHTLDVEEILTGLGIPYKVEYIEDDNYEL